MEKIIKIMFFLVIIPVVVNAQGLNSNAALIKKYYSDDYESTLKKYALAEWGQDYAMVVYEINRQADALTQLIDEFESENTNIIYTAIQEWSRKGYKNSNIKLFKKMDKISLNAMLKLYCDWAMVKYEYDRQVEAKNSF